MNTSSSHLSAICFEHIKDDYWYGAYGEFRVVMMKTNGWINATKMCNDGGKQFRDWTRLQSTKQLLAAYQRLKASENSTDIKAEADNTCGDAHAGIPAPVCNCIMVVQTFHITPEDKLISGTYCPADLIPSVAGCISPDFQLQANLIINHYLTCEYKAKLAESETQLARTDAALVVSERARQAVQEANVELADKLELEEDSLWHTELVLGAVRQDLTRTEKARADAELALMQAGEACALERVEK